MHANQDTIYQGAYFHRIAAHCVICTAFHTIFYGFRIVNSFGVVSQYTPPFMRTPIGVITADIDVAFEPSLTL